MKNQIIIIAFITFVTQMAIGQTVKPTQKIIFNMDLGRYSAPQSDGRSFTIGATYRLGNNIVALKNNFMNEFTLGFGNKKPNENFNHTSLTYGKTADLGKINVRAAAGLGYLTGTKRGDKIPTIYKPWAEHFLENLMKSDNQYSTVKVNAVTVPIEVGLSYQFKRVGLGINTFLNLSEKETTKGASISMTYQLKN